jgi:putative redox protein
MKVAVQWQDNMTFVGKPDSGFVVQMDADSSFGGTNNGVRPMELVALGLAGCTAMDVISIMQKKRQPVTQFEVRVNAPRSAEHPKVFTHALITYVVTGKNVAESALLRSIELAATKYCPAQFMLAQVFPMEIHYEIYEEQEDATPRLTSQGSWQALSVE